MSINKKAYDLCHEYIGLKEIDGLQNNEHIALAHHICGINSKGDVDSTIPWCSSWVNLCVVGACARLNPKRTVDMLRKRGFTGVTIAFIFDFAGVSEHFIDIDTGVPICEPTWSAASRSWDNWGELVHFEDARRGDIVRLTRDGGGHVAFLDEDELGILTLKILGGNQSNQVCSAERYSRTRLVQVRRAII